MPEREHEQIDNSGLIQALMRLDAKPVIEPVVVTPFPNGYEPKEERLDAFLTVHVSLALPEHLMVVFGSSDLLTVFDRRTNLTHSFKREQNRWVPTTEPT